MMLDYEYQFFGDNSNFDVLSRIDVELPNRAGNKNIHVTTDRRVIDLLYALERKGGYDHRSHSLLHKGNTHQMKLIEPPQL
jgi:hypothetical protein